jgi:hypothetical protein
MNDDFLTQYYQEPSRAFTLELYNRISKQKPSLLAGRMPFRNAILALVTIILIAACISKAVASRWNQVGDIWVPVQTGFNQDSYLWFIFHTQDAPLYFKIQEPVSFPAAEKVCDCVLEVPTWAPEKFTTDGEITLDEWFSGASPSGGRMVWIDPSDNQKSIALIFFPLSAWVDWNGNHQKIRYIGPYTSPAIPGSFQEVKVNGQPAVLVQGDWTLVKPDTSFYQMNVEAKWDEHAALSLYWVENDVEYMLYTTSSVITKQDLIQMAESAR